MMDKSLNEPLLTNLFEAEAAREICLVRVDQRKGRDIVIELDVLCCLACRVVADWTKRKVADKVCVDQCLCSSAC
jgi:hypothetical protein